jgi:hypothetical protein
MECGPGARFAYRAGVQLWLETYWLGSVGRCDLDLTKIEIGLVFMDLRLCAADLALLILDSSQVWMMK